MSNKFLTDATEVVQIIWRYVIWVAVTAALFVPAFLVSNDWAGNRKHSPFVAVAVFLVFSLICVAIHEIGHALAARSVGYDLHLIVIGPIGYRPATGTFQYIYRWDSGDFGGYVFGTPRSLGRVRWRDGLFILGGPVASLVFAAISYGVGSMVSGHLQMGFHALGMMSGAIGGLSLVPFIGSRGSPSDGGLLLRLARGQVPSEEAERSSLLSGLHVGGLAPNLWDDEIVAQIEAGDVNPSHRNFRSYMLLRRYLARGEFPKAKNLLENLEHDDMERYPIFLIEQAFLAALIDHDAVRGTALLRRLPDLGIRKSFNFWRAQAVVDAAAGRWAEAASAVNAARQAAKEEAAPPDADDNLIFAAIERCEMPQISATGCLS